MFFLGEHGDSSVPVWSGVSIGGLSMEEALKQYKLDLTTKDFDQIYADVKDSAAQVIQNKGTLFLSLSLLLLPISQQFLSISFPSHFLITCSNNFFILIFFLGYTNWAIGAAVCRIVEFIFHDSKRIVPLSTLIPDGAHGIKGEVFLSLPCMFNPRY